LLLKLENFLFCGGEFCPKVLQLGFLFGHIALLAGSRVVVGWEGWCGGWWSVEGKGSVYNTFNFILSASLRAVLLSKAS
jgi:hypothetical protein